MSLFEDDEHVELKLNTRFAEQYERKKKKEELSSLQEKYKGISESKAKQIARLKRKHGNDVDVEDALDDNDNVLLARGNDGGSDDDDDDSSSEEEDETGELVTPEIDAQILKIIALIRKRDPSVYAEKANFFDQNVLEAARSKWREKQVELKSKSKKVTLKDMEREQVLKGIVDVAAAEEAELAAVRGETHAEEQERLRAELKSAVLGGADSEDDDDDGLFASVEKSEEQLAAEEEEYRRFLLESAAAAGGEEYLQVFRDHNDGDTPREVDANEKFLMDFILNRGWIDKEDKMQGAGSLSWAGDEAHPADPKLDLDADEEELDKIDDFERQYNFRFEEAAALEGSASAVNIKTHAREVPESVRRKDDKRKRAREAKKERKEAEKMQKQEDLKRLKNLKRDEIMAKLREIAEISGTQEEAFEDLDLDAEFDPREWDSKMGQVFGEDYYAAEDDPEAKPEWDDDIDIADLVVEPAEPVAHVEEPVAAAPAAAESSKKKRKKKKKHDEDDDDFIEVPDADAMDVEEPAVPIQSVQRSAKAGPAAAAVPSAEVVNELDELYKLDYEDIVGGMPVRFRYREVRPASYGLSPEEILDADDAELNRFVSLRKLAPFRPPEVEERDIAKLSKKRRLAEFRQKMAEHKAKVDAELGNNSNRGGGHGAQKQTGRSDKKRGKPSDAGMNDERLAAYEPTSKKRRNK